MLISNLNIGSCLLLPKFRSCEDNGLEIMSEIQTFYLETLYLRKEDRWEKIVYEVQTLCRFPLYALSFLPLVS